jgi:hypothetical protein
MARELDKGVSSGVNSSTVLPSLARSSLKLLEATPSDRRQSAMPSMSPKRMKQMEYRDALDSQLSIKKEYEANGNMTHAEKMLNRQGLLAYKHREDKAFGMVPGVSPKFEMM